MEATEWKDLGRKNYTIVLSVGIKTGHPGSSKIWIGSQENRSGREGNIWEGMVIDYLEWEIIVKVNLQIFV